jgi:hypothetical protein
MVNSIVQTINLYIKTLTPGGAHEKQTARVPAPLPGPSTAPPSHFKPDESTGEKEKEDVSKLGERNGDEKDFSEENMQDHHELVRTPLMVRKEARGEGHGREDKERVVPGRGENSHLGLDEAAKEEEKGGNEEGDGERIGQGVGHGPEAESEGLEPHGVVGQQKQRDAEEAYVKHEEHECEHRLIAHGHACPRNEPVGYGLETPLKTHVIVKDPVPLAAQPIEIKNPPNQATKENDERQPRPRPHQESIQVDHKQFVPPSPRSKRPHLLC